MFFRKLPVALAAASLAVSSVAVQAAPVTRDSAPAADESGLGGSVGTVDLIFIGIAAALAVWALIETLDDDEAVSP
ncbi:hypothetical protein ACWPM1_06195 [Tsuneonella sp. HG249]|jgi:Spy/CpxP family protein refolding chaperone